MIHVFGGKLECTGKPTKENPLAIITPPPRRGHFGAGCQPSELEGESGDGGLVGHVRVPGSRCGDECAGGVVPKPQASSVYSRERKQDGQRARWGSDVGLSGSLGPMAREREWPFRAEVAWSGQACRPRHPPGTGCALDTWLCSHSSP